ncbi:hypothetical protein C8R44DRAFT_102696 [Mycena epipterygia]|nr:hypothetical protein C8R44DRAFT_102696 [Mycena epipterygia]
MNPKVGTSRTSVLLFPLGLFCVILLLPPPPSRHGTRSSPTSICARSRSCGTLL